MFLHLGSRDERRDTSASVPEADETMSVEPKKKGRFTVIENGTNSNIPRNPSLATITDAMKRSETGKPPLPGAIASGSTASAVLPRLQELMDQATQHQLALQKLVVAVQVGPFSFLRPPRFDARLVGAPSDNDSLRVALPSSLVGLSLTV